MKFPVLGTFAMLVAIVYAQDFDYEIDGGEKCDDFGKRCSTTLDCCGIYYCRAVDDKPYKICKVEECRALGKGCQVDSDCCSGVCTWVEPKNLNSGAREFMLASVRSLGTGYAWNFPIGCIRDISVKFHEIAISLLK
ncbi:hypothetical protein FPRO03_13901 [Fusarium proliferatum]|nr:hypothetical protein FPRO03_13901 [Fusarium proliferatum]